MTAVPELDTSEYAAALHAAATAALAAGDLDEALQLVIEATAHFIASSGVVHPDVARCDLLRAQIARAAGAYDEALDFVDGAIAARDAARLAS
jgi:hypothetical protein